MRSLPSPKGAKVPRHAQIFGSRSGPFILLNVCTQKRRPWKHHRYLYLQNICNKYHMLYHVISCYIMLWYVMGEDDDSDAMCFNQPDVWKRVRFGFRLWPLLHPTQRFASFTRSFGWCSFSAYIHGTYNLIDENTSRKENKNKSKQHFSCDFCDFFGYHNES